MVIAQMMGVPPEDRPYVRELAEKLLYIGRGEYDRMKPLTEGIIKAEDAAARRSGDILEEAPQSVKSGLGIDEIGKDGNAEVWHSKPVTKKARGASRKPKAGKAAHLPDFVPPCLATLQSVPPAGDEWVHEVKFDGYRVQARIADGKVGLLTRKGLDWSDKFGEPIARALGSLACDNAILDGEIVALGDNGISSFSALQAALSDGKTDRLIYYAFDVLYLDAEGRIRTDHQFVG